jgi:hypothetical protein
MPPSAIDPACPKVSVCNVSKLLSNAKVANYQTIKKIRRDYPYGTEEAAQVLERGR